MHPPHRHYAPRSHCPFLLGLLVFLAGLFPAAIQGLTIQTPTDPSYLETLAAWEVRRLIYLRTGERLAFAASYILPA